MTVAALFVAARGVYTGYPDIDAWTADRDARLYDGPHPVVAHPPCERWGRYATGGPSSRVVMRAGADGGCFITALEAVRRWGGVLEHPAGSAAWTAFGLKTPPRSGGWVSADWRGGTTCCVDQGHYGHPGQKATWLYACGVQTPTLRWGVSPRRAVVSPTASAEERRRIIRRGTVERLSKRQRASTPVEFRDVLLGIARSTR